MGTEELYPPHRLTAARRAATDGVDAALPSSGSDPRYPTGYDAPETGGDRRCTVRVRRIDTTPTECSAL